MAEMRVERRSGVERRRATAWALWRGTWLPRRRAGRRASDQSYPVVDWHSPRVLSLVVAVLGLCVLDGAFTVLLISNGATEVNPVMAQFLPHDLGKFAAVKLTLTSLGVFVLVACSRMKLFSRISGETILLLAAAAYLALIAYELELLAVIPSAEA